MSSWNRSLCTLLLLCVLPDDLRTIPEVIPRTWLRSFLTIDGGVELLQFVAIVRLIQEMVEILVQTVNAAVSLGLSRFILDNIVLHPRRRAVRVGWDRAGLHFVSFRWLRPMTFLPRPLPLYRLRGGNLQRGLWHFVWMILRLRLRGAVDLSRREFALGLRLLGHFGFSLLPRLIHKYCTLRPWMLCGMG